MDNQGVRKFPRVAADFLVEFTLDGKKFRSRSTTLGGGGLHVKLKDPPPIGTELLVRFRPAKHLGFIETKARVVYHAEEGAGLEFLSINADEQRTLIQLIRTQTGNRRQSPRAKLATQVEWQGLSSLALSRDVSVGGMFIETTEELAVGSVVKLRFHLEDSSDVVMATAEVSYTVASLGVGVRFLEMQPADRQRVARYVAEQPPTDDPASVTADED